MCLLLHAPQILIRVGRSEIVIQWQLQKMYSYCVTERIFTNYVTTLINILKSTNKTIFLLIL